MHIDCIGCDYNVRKFPESKYCYMFDKFMPDCKKHTGKPETDPGNLSNEAPGYVDLTSLERDLIELVGCKFHQIDEIDKGKWPGEYDITKWVDKYRGIQNLPPHMVELNNFRNEVNQFVSLIMATVRKYT